MTDYKQKYLKYKHKYIELKQVLHGGAINITISDLKIYIEENTPKNLKKAKEYLDALEIIRNKYYILKSGVRYEFSEIKGSLSDAEKSKIDEASKFLFGLKNPNRQPDDY
jgi:hypothetical protein